MGRHGPRKKAVSKDKDKKGSRFRGATWESNLIVGAILCGLGGSGRVTLVGTNSSWALLGIGIGLLIWGAVQWLRRPGR